MAESAVEELPLYLGEPRVKPVAVQPGVVDGVGRGHRRAIGGAGRGSMLVMTRIVPLPPSIAVDALLAWWRRPGRRAGRCTAAAAST